MVTTTNHPLYFSDRAQSGPWEYIWPPFLLLMCSRMIDNNITFLSLSLTHSLSLLLWVEGDGTCGSDGGFVGSLLAGCSFVTLFLLRSARCLHRAP